MRRGLGPVDEIVLARAPSSDSPLAVPWTGYRPRRRCRYWQVGCFIVDEEWDGYTWVMGRESLERLDRSPRVVLPDQKVPRALAMRNPDGGPVTFDSVLRQIEASVTSWSKAAPTR
jgi:hypothetical protein